MHRALPAIVSAQVLVSGDELTDRLDRLRAAWHARGFEVGPAVGGTFSVTAPPAHFEEVFGTRLVADDDGGIRAGTQRDLPLGRLPRGLREGVTLVTFGRPPSFGPGKS